MTFAKQQISKYCSQTYKVTAYEKKTGGKIDWLQVTRAEPARDGICKLLYDDLPPVVGERGGHLDPTFMGRVI